MQTGLSNAASIQQDILARIFLILAEDQNTIFVTSTGRRWDWLYVTEVCRYWYTVATETPVLWANFYHETFKSVTRTKKFLSLSKNSDLTVDFLHPGIKNRDNILCNLKMVLKEMRRIRHLRIDLHDKDDRPELHDLLLLLEQPAPRAETILLDLSRYGSSRTPHIRLPFTSSNFLERVELCGIDLLSNVSRLSGLSILRIHACHNLSLTELLGALEANSELTTLSLVFCDIDGLSLPQPVVHLSHLLDLTLRLERFSVIFDFIESLEVPNLLRWIVQCEEKMIFDDIVKLEVFSRLLEREYYFRRLKLYIHCDPMKSKIKVRILESDSKPIPGGVDFILDFDQVDLNMIVSYLIKVFRSQFRRAEDMDVDLPDDLVSVDTWHTIFCAAHSARTVHALSGLGNNLGSNYLKALARPRQQLHSEYEGGVPCPRLDQISIYHYVTQPSLDRFVLTLEEVLRARSVHGSAVRKLTVKSKASAYDDDKLKILSQWVQELEWKRKL